MAIIRDRGGLEKIVAFGGYDDVRTPRFPRFLATTERYSPVLRSWEWPEFGLDEPKAMAAAVTMPSSWLPQCEYDHFKDGAAPVGMPSDLPVLPVLILTLSRAT